MVVQPQGGVRFYAVNELDAHDTDAVQARVRQRILRAYQRRRLIDKDDRRDMEQSDYGSGFSLYATACIAANDRHGLERLLRYCARPLFASERIEELDAHRLIYHLPRPGPDGRTPLILSPLELIERIAALLPPPQIHRHCYYGALAPNAPLRAAVTALEPEAVTTPPSAPVNPPGEKST
ncbi:MAG: transposase [Pseudomonadota bacterium]|nr:transposase [Pseudomonadota bacterium]